MAYIVLTIAHMNEVVEDCSLRATVDEQFLQSVFIKRIRLYLGCYGFAVCHTFTLFNQLEKLSDISPFPSVRLLRYFVSNQDEVVVDAVEHRLSPHVIIGVATSLVTPVTNEVIVVLRIGLTGQRVNEFERVGNLHDGNVRGALEYDSIVNGHVEGDTVCMTRQTLTATRRQMLMIRKAASRSLASRRCISKSSSVRERTIASSSTSFAR